MIPQGLFTQIALIIVSVVILMTYVTPVFENISTLQDNILVYQQERQKVVSVNSQLASLLSRLETVSIDDKNRLYTYLPNQIDPINVSRDLVLITLQSGVFFTNVAYSGEFTPAKTTTSNSTAVTDDEPVAVGHAFELSVEGTYDQLKRLLVLMETNNYPLEVHQMRINQLEGGFLSIDFVVVTYQYGIDLIDQQIVF